MKIHFSKFERLAGAFIAAAAICFVSFMVIVAIKQGWFSTRHYFRTIFTRGDGLHTGTLVQIAGLRAGTVDTVKLNDKDEIEVRFNVTSDFRNRLRADSKVRVIRPFVIGDKVIEVTLGTSSQPMLSEEAMIVSENTMDLMDLMGGGKLAPYLETLDSVLKNLQVVAEAFSDPKRSKIFIQLFDEALPTMMDIQEVSKQMTKNKNLRDAVQGVSEMTKDMKVMLPQMVEFSKNLPELGQISLQTMQELTKLTAEMNKYLPLMAQIAPQLPEMTQTTARALTEAVTVLRAMQKSFLLKGSVKDVREEDEVAKKKEKDNKESDRQPASNKE